jgi:hypothetical protein
MGTTNGMKPKGMKDGSIMLQGLKKLIWKLENWESLKVVKIIWIIFGS